MFNNTFYKLDDYNSIKEEMSVAALHSVVANVGGTLQTTTHKADAWGSDAICTFTGRFTDDPCEKPSKDLHVQLKATWKPSDVIKNDVEFWTFSLDVKKLKRYLNWGTDLLFALFITPSPEEFERWVDVDSERVAVRKGLYWTFLHGFQVDETQKTNTVYIPKKNVLTPDALVNVVALARSGKGRYNV